MVDRFMIENREKLKRIRKTVKPLRKELNDLDWKYFYHAKELKSCV